MRPLINPRLLADIENSENLLSSILEDVDVILGNFRKAKPWFGNANWITDALSKACIKTER